MNAYRLPWVAPELRGPRWIRRRALRVFVRLAAVVPLVTFLAAHELDATTLELAVIPLLPATAIPFVRELLRFVVETLVRALLPRRRRTERANSEAPKARRSGTPASATQGRRPRTNGTPAEIAPLPPPARNVDIWTRTHRWNGRSPE